MTCDKCGSTMLRQDDGYVCPECGAVVSDPRRRRLTGSRLAGMLLAALGIGLSVLFFTQSSRYVLVLFNRELGFGMPCLGAGGVLLALFGGAIAAGWLDVASRTK